MHLPIGPLTSLGKGFDEVLPVKIIEENLFASVSTAHDVIHRSGILEAECSWHGMLITGSVCAVNRKYEPDYDAKWGAVLSSETWVPLGPNGSKPHLGPLPPVYWGIG